MYDDLVRLIKTYFPNANRSEIETLATKLIELKQAR